MFDLLIDRRRAALLRHRPAKLALAAGICAMAAGPVSAGELRNIVKDLYGGDGVTLSQTSNVIHEAHFTALSLQGLENLNSAIAANVGFLSFNSAVTGFELDLETGIPVRTSDSLGPLLAESGNTIGEGKFNLGFTYTRVNYKQFQGSKLSQQRLVLTHPDVIGPPLPGGDQGVPGPPDGQLADVVIFPNGVRTVIDLERDVVQVDININIDQDIYAFYGSYGLTSNWDVGVIIPVVTTRATADAFAQVIPPSPKDPDARPSPHSFEGSIDTQDSHTGGTETGIGDVILRTKYGLWKDEADLPDLALGGQLVLPTGDEKDLLGTGETRLMAMVAVSKAYGAVTPHLNLGYEWVPGDSELSSLRYIAGVDVAVDPKLTLAGDVLGRWEPDGDGVGDSVIDGAVGFKYAAMDTLILSFSLMFPLNRDEGLRADLIWTVGVEFTF